MAERELKSYPDIDNTDIPEFVRRCWERYQVRTEDLRKVRKENLGFYIGGKYHWYPGETEKREGQNRPWITINRCRPAADQIVSEARSNPPGPEAHPVGGGADKYGADVAEGYIREYEYRSQASQVRIDNAFTYAVAGGAGVYEMCTEFANEFSMNQRIKLKLIKDPELVFGDPDAIAPGKQDSMWGGRIYKYDKASIVAEYGPNLKILNQGKAQDTLNTAAGWLKDLFRYESDNATISKWTGGLATEGPYYVCEFYMVVITPKWLRLYTDGIMRFDDETVPKTVKLMDGEDEAKRLVPTRKVWKYVVTALDVISKTEWLGTTIPHFWITGPEIWRDGKLYQLCAIDGAKDANRTLNYTVTSIAEITGTLSKTPFIGFLGQFDVTNAQGFNPWDDINGKVYNYLEIRPTFATDPNGQHHLTPAPQKNTWEAPVAKLIEVASWLVEQIKGTTSVFFEPSLPSVKNAQSGEAIKALQQQSNIGTANWQDALHATVQLEYWQALIIMKKITSGQRAIQIIRPGDVHEIAWINKEFPSNEIQNGRHVKKDGTTESLVNIEDADFAIRVTAGSFTKNRTDEALAKILEAIHVAPQMLQQPATQASLVRMIGEGNPDVEAFADLIQPPQGADATPQQLQQQIQQLSSKSNLQTQVIQALQAQIQQKLPEIQQKKFSDLLKAVTSIKVAEIAASKDADRQQADILAAHLEQIMGFAHEAGTQAAAANSESQQQQSDQIHENIQTQQTQQHETATTHQAQQHEKGMQHTEHAHQLHAADQKVVGTMATQAQAAKLVPKSLGEK